MCEIFEVLHSGYSARHKAQKILLRDQGLIDLIVECQQCHRTYGICRVRPWIKRQMGKTVNLKALLRVMRRTNLLAQIGGEEHICSLSEMGTNTQICCNGTLSNVNPIDSG